MLEKFNRGSAFWVALVILVAGLSFGLGRLTKLEEAREPVKIESPVQEIKTFPPTSNPTSNSVVASREGEKYHWPWCSGAKRIKETNKIFFASPEEARKAGYTPAANCQGLP